MKKIKLTQGEYALVDNEDFERLSKHNWHFDRYAQRSIRENGKQKHWRMHWSVIGRSPKGFEVDHVNGNKLDNRKENLRVVIHSENQRNKGKSKNNTSGFKGVNWNKKAGRWIANIKINKNRLYLGSFLDKKLAYQAYCNACAKYHGEFARLK